MTHTFEMTKNPQHFRLAETIDNVNKDLFINLKNIYFDVGFFNISSQSNIRYTKWDESLKKAIVEGEINVKPGRYSIEWFRDQFMKLSWLDVSLDTFSQKITLTINTEGYYLIFLKSVRELLGFKDKILGHGRVYDGYYKINSHNVVHIHCDQVSTNDNFYNGNWSDVLETVPIGANKTGVDGLDQLIYVKFDSVGKRLINDRINELAFSVRECDHHVLINNQGKKIVLNLKIY